MKVRCYREGDDRIVGEYDCAKVALCEVARLFVEEHCDHETDALSIVVEPMDDEARALTGWKHEAQPIDGADPFFRLFKVTPTVVWSVREDHRFRIIAVTPIGEAETVAFVRRSDGTSAAEEMTVQRYPPSPEGDALRAFRCDGDPHLSLGDAGRLLGMSPADVSGLEMGRKTFTDPEDWKRIRAVLRPGGPT